MASKMDPMLSLLYNILMYFIFPAIISLVISEGMRKLNIIKQGDMKLNL